ncbi:MAG: hypothetical protein FWF27_01625 [Candidatus Bathyarchaeota archaeon]|nr:hypothetical protein [Candidatus Termiticorpusculum sp.]
MRFKLIVECEFLILIHTGQGKVPETFGMGTTVKAECIVGYRSVHAICQRFGGNETKAEPTTPCTSILG